MVTHPNPFSTNEHTYSDLLNTVQAPVSRDRTRHFKGYKLAGPIVQLTSYLEDKLNYKHFALCLRTVKRNIKLKLKVTFQINLTLKLTIGNTIVEVTIILIILHVFQFSIIQTMYAIVLLGLFSKFRSITANIVDISLEMATSTIDAPYILYTAYS